MDYEIEREKFKPKVIRYLLIAESPPPNANTQSSRHFYRAEKARNDDRLFTNTVKALFPEESEHLTEQELEADKPAWLGRFKEEGWYMIEALESSQEHGVTKKQRQSKIQAALPRLIERVKALADRNTKIILIKSNVFEVAAEPLRQAGFSVLNNQLLDYPGHFNQKAYRHKLAQLANSK